ncbi:MAG: hypothetical protein L0346_02490 [Chloroflexi bacterium]|nr:hypothetical protein [Chloroflexota bacterium]
MLANSNEVIDRLREISGEIPDLKRVEECPSEIAQSAFEKIEQLKPEVFSVAGFMVRDQKFSKVLIAIGAPAIPYLECALSTNDRDTGEKAISLLSKIGEPSISTLSSIFHSHESENYRISAAHALINISVDSQDIVKQGLSTQEENTRIAAVFGFAWVVDQALWGKYFDERHIKFTELLIPHLSDSSGKIRERVLRSLLDLKRDRFSTEESNKVIGDDKLMQIIDAALDDESSEVRRTALRGLLGKSINSSNAAILVKVLEDPSGQISNEAIEKLFFPRYSGQVDAESVVDAIINELVIRVSDRPGRNFNPEIVAKALNKTFEQNPQLYGQTLERLCNLAFDHQDSVRRRSIFVAKRINEGEFAALVHERADDDPLAAKAIFKALGSGVDIDAIADQISETDPSDIQRNAANQIKLLEKYYEDGLKQAKTSFNWALVITSISLLCLIIALYFLISTNASSFVSILTAIGSILTQFIAATIFYLYDQTRKQLTYYHQQMNQIQRFLLANSLIESLLDSDSRDKTRIELVKLIATMDRIDNDLLLPDKTTGSSTNRR